MKPIATGSVVLLRVHCEPDAAVGSNCQMRLLIAPVPK
jgi:hypothetical protein